MNQFRSTPDWESIFRAMRQHESGVQHRGRINPTSGWAGTPWFEQPPLDVAMGFMGATAPIGGSMKGVLARDAARKLLGVSPTAKYSAPQIRRGKLAWHGSPHKFDKFADEAIGTGEGAQAYGYGHYFADRRGTALDYRNRLSPNTIARWEKGGEDARWGGLISDEADRTLSRAFPIIDQEMRKAGGIVNTPKILEIINKRAGDISTNTRGPMRAKNLQTLDDLRNVVKEHGLTYNYTPGGHLYKTALKVQDDALLHWDKPLSEQPKAVREALDDIWNQDYGASKRGDRGVQFVRQGHDYFLTARAAETGHEAYRALEVTGMTHDQVAQALKSRGVKGIKYLDQGSRSSGDGTYNYVIFDPEDAKILETLGIGAIGLASNQERK